MPGKSTKRNFILPNSDIKEGLTKIRDARTLLSRGENIATTHSLFVSFTDEIKELIKRQQYVLVLDEVIDVMQMASVSKNDLGILIRSQSIVEHEGSVEWCDDEYSKSDGGRFREEMLMAQSHNFLKHDDQYFFWSIPPELFGCFSDVYVLTYMFDAQFLPTAATRTLP